MENEKRLEEQFASLPLGEKVASLFNMELATISEAFTYLAKEPMRVVQKIGDLAVEFGNRVEEEFNRARTKSGHAEAASETKQDPDKTDPSPAAEETGPTEH